MSLPTKRTTVTVIFIQLVGGSLRFWLFHLKHHLSRSQKSDIHAIPISFSFYSKGTRELETDVTIKFYGGPLTSSHLRGGQRDMTNFMTAIVAGRGLLETCLDESTSSKFTSHQLLSISRLHSMTSATFPKVMHISRTYTRGS